MTHPRRSLLALALLCTAVAGPTNAQGVLRVDGDAAPGGDGLSWATAFDDLQDGLAAAQAAAGAVSELWIAEGTYRPDGGTFDKELRFELVSGVALYGGFDGSELTLGERDWVAHVTTLSGDLFGNDPAQPDPGHPGLFDNSRHVVGAHGTGAGTRLDGLAIRGGSATGSGDPTNDGAGVLITGGASLTIANCELFDHVATGEGAAIYADDAGALDLIDTVIRHGIALSRGGALSVATGGAITFDGCTVELCEGRGSGQGGALDLREGSLVAIDTLFRDNRAATGSSTTGDGGAGRLSNDSAHFTGCTFLGNEADDGGALELDQVFDVVLIDCWFEANTARFGGAIYRNTSGAPFVLEGCTFLDNVAQNEAGAAFVDSVVAVAGCLFEGNHSVGRAGALTLPSAGSVRDTAFRGNTSDSGGGAVYLSTARVDFTACEFVQNRCLFGGGAVWVNGESPRFVSCLFAENEAGRGGALNLEDHTSATVTGCALIGNVASTKGGAIHIAALAPRVSIESSTFSANSAPDGAALWYPGFGLALYNTIVWGNPGGSGSGWHAQIGSGSYVAPALPKHWRFSCVEGFPVGPDAQGNRGSDPQFQDPAGPDGLVGTEDDDLRLGVGSECIDAGSNLLVPPDRTDLDQDLDVLELLPFDLDFAPRLMDDAGAPDTGEGGAPIVDMGCYEA